MKNKIIPIGLKRTLSACIILLITLSSLLYASVVGKNTQYYVITSVFCGVAIIIIGLSLQEWMVHRYLYHRHHKNRLMKHIYNIHHVGHHSVIFPPERYVTNGSVKRHPIFEKDITKLGETPSNNFLTRLSHSGSYILLTFMTIIGPSWLITNNNIFLISTIVATIIICYIVVTVHDAIHYPSQHPIIQNQKFFKFLDNHHFIHHICTEKNVNFLLPICDFLFGTIKLNLCEDERKIYGTLELAKQNPIGYSEPAKDVMHKAFRV